VSSMLEIGIPSRGLFRLQHLLLDVNGTLALDGQILDGVAERLRSLAGILQPRLVSADTHGTAAALGVGLGLPVTRLQPGDEAAQKAALVEEFGAAGVVAIGNGANDEEMLRRAALGIAVLGPEGMATPCLLAADVVARDIHVALDLLMHPHRLLATLRA